MDYGLCFHAFVVLFLDDRGPIDWLPLLDDRGTFAVAIPIVIAVAGSDSYAHPDRTDANTDFFGHRRDGKRTDSGSDKQKFSHGVLLV
jgi:hypothetical protein